MKLKVTLDLSADLESVMWDLYKDYESEFDNQAVFNPAGDLAALALQVGAGQAPHVEYRLIHAMVESDRLSSQHTTRRRFEVIPMAQMGQQAIREDILSQGWIHSSVP